MKNEKNQSKIRGVNIDYGFVPEEEVPYAAGWIASLKWEDLRRLRKIVQAVHFQYYPKHMQTDVEADRIIESLGPAVAEKMLRKLVESAND